jgi:hypothetical protein
MCKSRVWTPKDLRFVVEIKEALLVPHMGPDSMPRKAVPAGIGRTEGWYSRILNLEEREWLPDVVDLRKIARVTGNREPLRVLARWLDEDLVNDCRAPDESPFALLARTVEADEAFTAKLSKDLVDGVLDPTEAALLIPMAASRVVQAQEALDAVRKHAGRK